MHGENLFTVTLDDALSDEKDLKLDEILNWASTQCPGFVGYRLSDDFDYARDAYSKPTPVLRMYFNDQKSAVWFQLKWK
jgi:hypothetical protein